MNREESASVVAIILAVGAIVGFVGGVFIAMIQHRPMTDEVYLIGGGLFAALVAYIGVEHITTRHKGRGGPPLPPPEPPA